MSDNVQWAERTAFISGPDVVVYEDHEEHIRLTQLLFGKEHNEH